MWGGLRRPMGPFQVTCVLATAGFAAAFSTAPFDAQQGRGTLPTPDALDVNGLNLPAENLIALTALDVGGWKKEADDIAANYARFGERMPPALIKQLEDLRARLAESQLPK